MPFCTVATSCITCAFCLFVFTSIVSCIFFFLLVIQLGSYSLLQILFTYFSHNFIYCIVHLSSRSFLISILAVIAFLQTSTFVLECFSFSLIFIKCQNCWQSSSRLKLYKNSSPVSLLIDVVTYIITTYIITFHPKIKYGWLGMCLRQE